MHTYFVSLSVPLLLLYSIINTHLQFWNNPFMTIHYLWTLTIGFKCTQRNKIRMNKRSWWLNSWQDGLLRDFFSCFLNTWDMINAQFICILISCTCIKIALYILIYVDCSLLKSSHTDQYLNFALRFTLTNLFHKKLQFYCTCMLLCWFKFC